MTSIHIHLKKPLRERVRDDTPKRWRITNEYGAVTIVYADTEEQAIQKFKKIFGREVKSIVLARDAR